MMVGHVFRSVGDGPAPKNHLWVLNQISLAFHELIPCFKFTRRTFCGPKLVAYQYREVKPCRASAASVAGDIQERG
jgi:hypothetical protein